MSMRALSTLLLACAACVSDAPRPGTEAKAKVKPITPGIPKALAAKESTKLMRRTNTEIRTWSNLKGQGKIDQARSLRAGIATTVDKEFATFVKVGREGELNQLRNMAVKALGFARRRSVEARVELQNHLRDRVPTIVENAAYGLGLLAAKDTDLTRLIELVGNSLPKIRARAAFAVGRVLFARGVPRKLTAEDHSAVANLVGLLNAKANVMGRRAAAAALADLQSSKVQTYLVGALEDEDTGVQVAALLGIWKVADLMAAKPVIAYLESGPPSPVDTYAVRALNRIAIRHGLAKDEKELKELGKKPGAWRDLFAKVDKKESDDKDGGTGEEKKAKE